MRRVRRSTAAALALSVLLANSACYYYQPVVGAARPGSVRIELTSEGTAELARSLGPSVRAITGELVEWRAGDTLVVVPQWVRTSGGMAQPWIGEGAVSIARSDLRTLDERRFNRRRTTLMAAGVTAGLVSIAIAALKSGGAHGGVSAGGGTPAR